MNRAQLAVAILEHPDLARAWAERQIKARKPVVKPKSKRPAAKERQRKRASTREAARQIRAEVMARADGKCEWCEAAVGAGRLHWHHLYGGVGRRRQEQSTQNTVALCHPCHEDAHDSPSFQRVMREHFGNERAEEAVLASAEGAPRG